MILSDHIPTPSQKETQDLMVSKPYPNSKMSVGLNHTSINYLLYYIHKRNDRLPIFLIKASPPAPLTKSKKTPQIMNQSA